MSCLWQGKAEQFYLYRPFLQFVSKKISSLGFINLAYCVGRLIWSPSSYATDNQTQPQNYKYNPNPKSAWTKMLGRKLMKFLLKIHGWVSSRTHKMSRLSNENGTLKFPVSTKMIWITSAKFQLNFHDMFILLGLEIPPTSVLWERLLQRR